MYGIMYSMEFSFTHVTTGSNCFNISPAANDFVVLHSIRLGQINLEGDAESAMETVLLSRVAGIGSGGSESTPAPHMEGAPACTAVVRKEDTTVAGTPTVILKDAWNVQAGWLYIPTPEERVIVSASSNLTMTCVAPVASMDLVGAVTFEEILA
jgi:hypothetical protein